MTNVFLGIFIFEVFLRFRSSHLVISEKLLMPYLRFGLTFFSRRCWEDGLCRRSWSWLWRTHLQFWIARLALVWSRCFSEATRWCWSLSPKVGYSVSGNHRSQSQRYRTQRRSIHSFLIHRRVWSDRFSAWALISLEDQEVSYLLS